jgi:indole-3-glycerol phosphate synthase
MKSILQEIIVNKRKEVEERKEKNTVKTLESSIYFPTTPISLKSYLSRDNSSGIIAEIKRKSPSKGFFKEHISVENISISYMQHGASALSILTDRKYFGGTQEDLKTARIFNFCPILCKDFIIDEYQIIEAKSYGADVILLIADILDKNKLKQLARFAKSLQLEVLFEIHSEEELDKVSLQEIDHLGINSRNLNTFEVNVSIFETIRKKLPSTQSVIAESGLKDPSFIKKLKNIGFSGFLIGEHFMASTNPGKACGKLVDEIL